MWRTGVVIVVAALGAGACTGSVGDQPTSLAPGPSTTTAQPTTTPTSSHPPTIVEPDGSGIILPSVLDIDTGVLDLTPQPTSEAGFRELFDDLAPRVAADDAVVYDIDECRLVAPGQWRISGTIDAPPDAIGRDLGVEVAFVENGVVIAAPVRATIRASGEFAIPIDFAALSRIEGVRHLPDDLSDACNMTVRAASTPITTYRDSAPTRYETSIDYTAPRGSLQALGIGADLVNPDDPRRSWAYATYFDREIPFEALWLPSNEPVALAETETGERLCRVAVSTLRNGDITIRQTRDCDEQKIGVPTSRDGWWQRVGHDVEVYTSTDDGLLSISATGSFDGEDLLEVAGDLERYVNVRYRIPEGASADLDEFVGHLLRSEGWTERGRHHIEDRWFVAATRTDERESDELVSWHRVVVYEIVETSDGLWTTVAPLRRPGRTTTSCLMALEPVTEDRRRAFTAVAAGEDWTLQELTPVGWTDLPTVRGTAIELGDRNAVRAQIRAVDRLGNPVRCTTGGTGRTADEQWSDYRSPDRGGLEIDAPGASSVMPGAVIAVDGSGAYRRKTVELRICRAATTEWVDHRDCDEGTTISVRADFDGGFSTNVKIPATITTADGTMVDCRIEHCAVRADTAFGIHRSGSATIAFREDT